MKLALLFPGYGSQFVGMGKELYDEYRIVQEYFEEASNCANINFVKLNFASSDAEISNLQNGNLSLFLTTVSTIYAIKNLGIEIDLVAGHGIGEFAAICCANVIIATINRGIQTGTITTGIICANVIIITTI